ncbi:hypothetical protein [Zavarzinia sp. CC-PAN008]|uniref:hypothetical protein n=1 Tax=Zavarzinia sp. CC-PAN008 TaxID=3243332 RepID=UPI003F744700
MVRIAIATMIALYSAGAAAQQSVGPLGVGEAQVHILGQVPSLCEFKVDGGVAAPSVINLGDLTLGGVNEYDGEATVQLTCNSLYRVNVKSKNGGLTLGDSPTESDIHKRLDYEFGWRNLLVPSGEFLVAFDGPDLAGQEIAVRGGEVFTPQFGQVTYTFLIRWVGRSDLYAGDSYRDEVTISVVPLPISEPDAGP